MRAIMSGALIAVSSLMSSTSTAQPTLICAQIAERPRQLITPEALAYCHLQPAPPPQPAGPAVELHPPAPDTPAIERWKHPERAAVGADGTAGAWSKYDSAPSEPYPMHDAPTPAKTPAPTWGVRVLPPLPANAEHPAETPAPVEHSADNPSDEDSAFTQCIIPKIQYGEYSSYDGGKSANAILLACSDEWLAWDKYCQANQKPNTMDCRAVSLFSVQIMLKRFGK